MVYNQESKSILSLMNTRFWLDIIGSMGYNILNNRFETENSLFDWNISIIDYQQDVIDHFLYTSRVHDLIELSIEGNKLALTLLQRLKDQTDDDYEYDFLSGKNIDQITVTNKTLKDYVLKWITGEERMQPIKHW